MVPGIEASPDKMLQGRLFSYSDTHRHRLGANYQQIPVNCPFAARAKNYQRDGPLTFDDNQNGAPNYFPNSFSGPQDDVKYLDTTKNVELKGDVARYNTQDDENFAQVGVFWEKVLSEEDKEHLISNMSGHLKNAAAFIQKRAVDNFTKCHQDYGRRLQAALDKHNGK